MSDRVMRDVSRRDGIRVGASAGADPEPRTEAPRELRGRIGSCVEHGSAAEFYEDGSGQCLYCCQVETLCDCVEARARGGPSPEPPCNECGEPMDDTEMRVLDKGCLARLRRAQGGPSLDVERLARVLAEHFGPSYFPGLTDVTIHGETPEAIAERIAAEYARLGVAPKPD